MKFIVKPAEEREKKLLTDIKTLRKDIIIVAFAFSLLEIELKKESIINFMEKNPKSAK